MDFGYKTIIAVALAANAMIRAKAQPDVLENNKLKTELKDSTKLSAINDIDPAMAEDVVSNYILNEKDIKSAEAKSETGISHLTAEQKDSLFQEQIYQSILEIEHDVVRLIAHFENIKMNAYYDKVARKWTIGFGNIKHPNGKPVRRGDKIKDEDELMFYFRDYFKQHVAPNIAKYLPTWPLLNKQGKMVMVDMFWNAGSGQGVLFSKKEYDADFARLDEKHRQELAERATNLNQSVTYQGTDFNFSDLPEWRNLGVTNKKIMTSLYANNNFIKGYDINTRFTDKWSCCDEEQRQDIAGMLLRQKAQKDAAMVPYAVQQMPQTWNFKQVNDSTVHHTGYVVENDYTLSDVPEWYKLSTDKQQQICKMLAAENDHLTYQGRQYEVKNIPIWYFLNKTEKDLLKQYFPENMLVRKNGDESKKPVLSNLGYELNTYAVTQTPEARERVAVRLASYIHSRGKEVSALQNRANIRAMIFLGKIELNGSGENSINLEDVHIGASYSVKTEDLDNAKVICDTVKGCVAGRNFKDTLDAQLHPQPKSRLYARGRSSRAASPRPINRTGARGR